MIDTNFLTPHEVAEKMADNVRKLRLGLNWSQLTLSRRSGVSLGVLKLFERSGKISLISLLKIALTLGRLGDFLSILESIPKGGSLLSLEQILKSSSRKRGRQ